MKDLLENNLINKYKVFFQYLSDNNTPLMDPNDTIHDAFMKLKNQETPVLPLQFGIECGDGWYWLLDNLMHSINQHIYYRNQYPGSNPRFKWLNNFAFKLRIRLPFKCYILNKLGDFINRYQPMCVSKPIVFEITQIKEKYGGLRFYCNGGDLYISGMIDLAESMSYTICEKCGTTKNVGQTSGWIYTCCESCYKKNKVASNLKWTAIDKLNSK